MLVPKKNPYVSGEISVFDTLVTAGEKKSHITLPFQLHVFLVGCLTEHLRDTGITHHVLAIGLLRSATRSGESGNVLLKRSGDAALLLAGLFPERALRLHVSSRYFRFMGQAAYANLAAKLQAIWKEDRWKFYDGVVENFQSLETVLSAARAQPETNWEFYQRFLASLQ